MKAVRLSNHLRPLMPHQVEAAYEYGLNTRHPAFLMEMRLGKTLASIRYVKRLEAHRVLVVAPLQVFSAWHKELFLDREPFVSAFGVSADERRTRAEQAWDAKRRTWMLINYEGLISLGETKERVTRKALTVEHPDGVEEELRGEKRKKSLILPEIAYWPWDVVLLDESTKIKTPDTLVTQACCDGFRSAHHRGILTGAVQTESPLEVYNQFRFLHGSFMGSKSWYGFRNRWFEQEGRYEWTPKPGAARAIQEEVHRLSFVRRRKDVGLKDRKIYERRTVQMSAKQRKMYRAIEDEFTAYLLSGGTWETEYAVVQRTWLAKLAGGFDPDNQLVSTTKADDILELLRGELSGEKLNVWFRYRHELHYVSERLRKAGITHIALLGGMGPFRRDAELEKFQRGRARVMLATEDCLKYGVDASVSDAAYYYSNSDSGESRIQSEDRNINPFKDKSLLLIDAVTEGTVDEDIVQAVHDKALKTRLFHTSPKKRFLQRRGLA